MRVKIRVIGGAYYGTEWIGALADAPVTMLIPEGIVSARTAAESNQQRGAVRAALEHYEVVEITATKWALRITRLDDTTK